MSRHFSRSLPVIFWLLWCMVVNASAADPVVIRYWEKWNGFEAEAMRQVVEDFNASQDKIRVEYVSVSQIDRRLMLAIAGGVPPDVAGIWANNLAVYAENNALMPLDRMAADAGIRQNDYLPIIWKICNYRGHLWALPSTPSSTALIYNKRMFREAGLDPERPPRTIRELEEFNERILKTDAAGRILKIGHLPEEPGWWNTLWGLWFGSDISRDGRLNVLTPENLAAHQWIQTYPERFGAANLLALKDGFGTFASPQNPFFSGRVAMVLQGVWIHNFIKNYAPADFEWGVAPFPSANPGNDPVCIVDCDLLVIPNGAPHPREAFEFLRYVNSQGPMEKLCHGQRKFSPKAEVSEAFYQNHPNPRIRDFVGLARSPGATMTPQLTTWNQFQSDMKNAVGRIWSGRATAEEALQDVQHRQEKALSRSNARWEHLGPELKKKWGSQ